MCRAIGRGVAGHQADQVAVVQPRGGLRQQVDLDDAQVGGKIAQLGSRLIDGFAKKMADEFFTRFQDALEGPEEGESDEETNTEDAPKKGWFKRMIGA